MSDIQSYEVTEHWPGFSEIPDEGVFEDDCDGFMQMVRKALAALGEPSRMQAVGVNSPKVPNHAACRYGDWILDNTNRRPMKRADLVGWTFFTHSDNTVKSLPDKWYKTL